MGRKWKLVPSTQPDQLVVPPCSILSSWTRFSRPVSGVWKDFRIQRGHVATICSRSFHKHACCHHHFHNAMLHCNRGATKPGRWMQRCDVHERVFSMRSTLRLTESLLTCCFSFSPCNYPPRSLPHLQEGTRWGACNHPQVCSIHDGWSSTNKIIEIAWNCCMFPYLYVFQTGVISPIK